MTDDFNLDFGDFSPDYDLSYDLDDGHGKNKPKKKGAVIKEFAAGLWEGATAELTSYGVPQRLIKSILPRSYGPALDSVDRTLRFKDDLYDKVRENTKDTVHEFRELTREALSIHGNKIPEKLAKRLEAWANDTGSADSWREYATENGDQLNVDADTTDLLAAMAHGTAATAELSQAQHEELLAALAAGAVANQKSGTQQSVILDQILTMQRRLVGHTESITSTYQRRSLELQYRHYKLDISVAKMQEQYYKRSLEAFSNIVTNSTLTEIEKSYNNRNHQRLINKTQGSGKTRQMMSRYGNHLYDSVYGMVDSASQNTNNRWAGAAGAAGAAMRAAQQAKMSGSMNGARNKGAMAGSMLASAAPFLLQQLFRSRMERNEGANRRGHNLSYYAESAPGLINGWLRNRQNFDENFNEFDPNNKWYTRLQKGVLNPVMNNALFNLPVNQGNKTRINTPGIKDLMQPAQYDQMSRRSLVEVIPGLLTQQLRVQQNLVELWGGEKQTEQAFNHKQGAFTSKARVKADVRSSIFNRSEFQSAAGSFNSMVEAIDPEEELSPNARVALAMRFARDADAGDGFNINNYLSESGWINASKETIREINDFLHKRFETKEATGVAAKFGKYQIGDKAELSELRKRVATNMQSQQNYMPNVEESVNSLANGGQRALLKEMGIIQRVNGKEVFNHDMYWKMMEKFISNPNFRPDLEDEEGKPKDLTDRVDTGALKDLGDKVKDRVKGGVDDVTDRLKGGLNDLGSSDTLSNAKDKVDSLLNRGKDTASDVTARLRATMTRDTLNRLYDDAIGKYDDLVTQLQTMVRSGNDVDIRIAIAEVKERGAQVIRHIQQQLHELDAEALGEDAYEAAKSQGEAVIKSLRTQLDALDLSNLRSGIDTNIVTPAASLMDTVSNKARNVVGGKPPVTEALPESTPEATPEVALAAEQNDLMRELIAVSASVRDQVSAAKDATMAQITGDPNVLTTGVEERKGFLKSLGARMQSREAKSVMGALGLAKLVNSGAFTLAKWTTVGPAIVGFKGAKALYKFFKKKKDGEVGDTDGDGIRENSWMDRLRKRKAKPEKEKTDKDGKPKDKPDSIFGLLSGIWGAVTGLFGGITKFGILGGLANFLKLDWLKSLGGLIGSIFKGKEAITTGSDLLDQAGDLFGGDDNGGDDDSGGENRDGRKKRRGRGRGAARERLERMRNRNQPRGGILKRGAKWIGKNVIGKGARALINEPGNMAGRASWLLKGGAKTLAKRIPAIGALGMGAFEMYNSYQANDGLGMADAAGGMGGAWAGAAAGAAIGSVVPVVGTFIGGVAGAAIGGFLGSSVGSSLYKWIKSPGLLQQMRLYQYGLDSINSDFTGKIFALEQACEPYVRTTDSGNAMLDPKIPMAELARPFIQDPDNRDEVQQFAGWFVQRFKPVFLTHFAVAKQMFPGVKFADLDDSKDNAAKYEMAKRCQEFDPSIDHPYRWSGMLFNTQPAIGYDQTVQEVKAVVERLKAEVKKTDKDVKSTSLVLTGDDTRERGNTVDKGVIDAIKPTNGKPLKNVNLDGHKVSAGWGQETTVVSVQDVLGSILPAKGQPLDDLTAARMKIYGLPNLDVSRVSVLLQLELVIQNRIAFNGRGVQFTGKTKEVFDVMASSFGHGWLSSFSFTSWSKWFSRRFLPAYLAFASTVYNQTGDNQPTLNAGKLPPETKLAIIQAMTGQTYNDGRNELNVWTVADSPWSDLDTSNTDATILDVHINNLKLLAKKAQYEAKPVKGGVQQSEDGTTDKDWRTDKSTGKQTTNAVKGSDGLVRSSANQETVYDPKTGQTTGSYGGGSFGAGAAGSGAGGIDTTGKDGPAPMGPGTEEGVRAMVREAAKAGITDKKELAIMLANTHHETGGFRQVEENLRYKPQTLMKLWPKRFPTADKAQQLASAGPVAIANSIYGDRMGNSEPGDGWKYRGRGFIQLTGKENYARASKALGVDLVDDPDQVAADPEMAAASALYFWKANKRIGERAKEGDVAGVRKIVNGGTIGLEDTQKLASQYMQTLNSGEYDDILSGKDKGDTGTTSDGGQSMADAMAQSAQDQAQQAGVDQAAATNAGTPGATPPAAAATDAADAAPPPPGSTTNIAPPAGAPSMESTTGPSAEAAQNAESVTPNAKDSTASADAMNKSNMQTQTPAPAAPLQPVPVAMDDTHGKATAANTATTNEKLDQMISALQQIAGTNKAMAEKEDAPAPAAAPASPANPAVPPRNSPTVGSNNGAVSMRRAYSN